MAYCSKTFRDHSIVSNSTVEASATTIEAAIAFLKCFPTWKVLDDEVVGHDDDSLFLITLQDFSERKWVQRPTHRLLRKPTS
jgi:hypothetical protein